MTNRLISQPSRWIEVKEARQEMHRRRLRFAIAALIVVVAALAIWWGSGGTTHPAQPLRVGTHSPKRDAPTDSTNTSTFAVLEGQSLNQVVPYGANTLWVSTANEIALSGGGQGIERTTNAGRSWTNVTPPGLSVDGGNHWIGGFTTLSSTRAWIVYGSISNGPQILETTGDAGSSWSKVGVLPPGGCQLQFVTVHDGTCTVLGGAGGSMILTIYRTANGGASWRRIFQNTPSTISSAQGSIPFACDKSVYFTSATKGFTLFFCNGGSGAIIYETMNGGVTWQERNVTPPSSVPSGGGGYSGTPAFTGTKGAVPYSVGNDSLVYVTNNGGLSFHPVYPPGPLKYWTEDIISPSVWRLTYGKEILATNDGGRAWFSVSSDTLLHAVNYVKGSPTGGIVEFTTASDGWLTENGYAPNSSLLRTTDGGHQWRKVTVPGTEKLRHNS